MIKKSNTNNETSTLESLYTSLSDSLVEISERRKMYDENIQTLKNMSVSLEDLPPDLIEYINEDSRPIAFFSRYIRTPNFETKYFMDIVENFGFRPAFLLYNGKCSLKNKDHYYLCKYCERSGDGKKIFEKRLANMDSVYGTRVKDITTLDHGKLSDFHEKLWQKVFPDYGDKKAPCFDITEWFEKWRDSEFGYYYNYLGIFSLIGVLFENLLSESETDKEFLNNKIIPSFNNLLTRTKLKPLIVPLLPMKIEKDSIWYNYPEDTSSGIILS